MYTRLRDYIIFPQGRVAVKHAMTRPGSSEDRLRQVHDSRLSALAERLASPTSPPFILPLEQTLSCPVSSSPILHLQHMIRTRISLVRPFRLICSISRTKFSSMAPTGFLISFLHRTVSNSQPRSNAKTPPNRDLWAIRHRQIDDPQTTL